MVTIFRYQKSIETQNIPFSLTRPKNGTIKILFYFIFKKNDLFFFRYVREKGRQGERRTKKRSHLGGVVSELRVVFTLGQKGP